MWQGALPPPVLRSLQKLHDSLSTREEGFSESTKSFWQSISPCINPLKGMMFKERESKDVTVSIYEFIKANTFTNF